MRLKISDGDLIMIGVPTKEGHANKVMEDAVNQIFDWAKQRGLQGIKVMALNNQTPGTVTIDVLSVNDIFEDVVLKEK